jgi:hypothetical protein
VTRRPRKRVIGILATFSLLAVPIAATAVTPKKDSYFAYCPRKYSCTVNFETTRTGKRIQNFRYFNSCANVPVLLPKLKITKGRFGFRGVRRDTLRRKINVRISGRFITSRKAKGTARYTRSNCTAKTAKYTAKRTRRAISH